MIGLFLFHSDLFYMSSNKSQSLGDEATMGAGRPRVSRPPHLLAVPLLHRVCVGPPPFLRGVPKTPLLDHRRRLHRCRTPRRGCVNRLRESLPPLPGWSDAQRTSGILLRVRRSSQRVLPVVAVAAHRSTDVFVVRSAPLCRSLLRQYVVVGVAHVLFLYHVPRV